MSNCSHDLLIVPRVSNLRNGLFRSEVVWSKGRASDILFGEIYDDRVRAGITAYKAAGTVLLSAAGIDRMWSETARSLDDCSRLINTLMTTLC